VRATTLLRRLLKINCTSVSGFEFEDRGLVIDVQPTTELARCSGCGRVVRKLYDGRERRWRHLDLAGMQLHLRYRLRRVDCRSCGVVVELVPWAAAGSHFTYAFEEMTAYLAQHAAKTVVVEAMRIAWATVGTIIRRVVDRKLPADRLEGLTHIGIDELSYRRHHEYVTVVVDHRRGGVVWAAPGKNADTLRSFFAELGPERCRKLEAVTIDMSAAYIKAVTEASPDALVVFDKFHVQRLAHDALDEVRRSEVRSAPPEARHRLKHTRFALQKSPWNLTVSDEAKLAEVQQTNRRLYRAYLLKDSLAAILRLSDFRTAAVKLDEWISWASRSRLVPFVRAAQTIATHMLGILTYVATGMTNARTEGLNGKTRTITKRSYGFHSASSLIAMLFLCCSGLALMPPRTLPCTH
jgi:transposase